MSNNTNGFVMITNSIRTSEIWHDLHLLWLYLYFCLRAETKETVKIMNWQNIYLKKWQCLYYQKHISEYFGVSIGYINKSIKLLKKYWLCENKNTNKHSIIEPKNIINLPTSWKQNENEMKAKWNNSNNNNKLINSIYYEISKIWENKFWINENIEDLYINFTFEDFKKSFENYIKILESDFTYYHYKFKLRDFISSPKWFKQFLNAKFEDYIDWRKQEEFEILKTHEKVKKIKQKELLQIQEEDSEQKAKNDFFENFKKSNLYLDNVDKIKSKILEEYPKANFTKNIFLAYERSYIIKNYYWQHRH